MVLKAIRESNGYTQESLATAIGVTQSSVASYESGARRPSTEVAKRIAKYFDLSIEQIWEMFYSPKERDHAVPSA